MEIQFVKQDVEWVAEFEATGPFNLHLQREDESLVKVYQKSDQDSEYATLPSWKDHDATKVINIDFAALVYPKWIKIVSLSEVSKGLITM